MTKKWLWLKIGVVLLPLASLATGCAPSKPGLERQRHQDAAGSSPLNYGLVGQEGPVVHPYREKNDGPTQVTESAKPQGKYQTGQVWQDCKNRGYVKIVELLYPESPEEGRSGFDYSLIGQTCPHSNPYVHILRLDDNTAESYRKKDFEKRFRYAPEGRQ